MPDAEHEMAPAREPLREAVEEAPSPARPARAVRTAGLSCHAATTNTSDATATAITASVTRSSAARQFTALRTRISGVDLTVDDAIEAHRRESGAGEREHDPAERAPT